MSVARRQSRTGRVDDNASFGGVVPATFLVAEVAGQIVGRTSIRAKHRRREDATAILPHSLISARAVGIDRVLVTCDEGNVGSAAVIERCGGVFESLVDADPAPAKRRYWID